MQVVFAMFFGAFGIISALVGYFVFDISLLAAFNTYIILGGVAPFALIAANAVQDEEELVERRATPRTEAY